MKLYLHIGTEKTGSSFLQHYLAKNRHLLRKHKIYYPKAGIQEANMLKGRITPGNASDLNKLLEDKAWIKVQNYFKRKIKEANTNNCNVILLSNEILSITLSKENKLKKLHSIIQSLNILLEGVLLIIREPVSQALSLYKHRLKCGRLLPLDKWLQEQYFLPEALSDFYKRVNTINLPLLQYPYKKDSKYLVDICLNKWLKLSEELKVIHKIVNASLTLSELSLLYEVYEKDKFLGKKYYRYMLELDSKLKSDDLYFKNYVQNYINNFMIKYNTQWKTVSANMSTPIEPYNYKHIKFERLTNTKSFSIQQLEQLAKFINYSSSSKYFLFKQVNNFKKFVKSLTPKILQDLRIYVRNNFLHG